MKEEQIELAFTKDTPDLPLKMIVVAVLDENQCDLVDSIIFINKK